MSFFLSYSSKNKGLVLKFKEMLESAGISCWIDKSDIPPAEDWGDHIDEALRKCDGVIVCITPESNESTYVHYEWAYALGWHHDLKQRRVVGVKLVDLPTKDIHPRLQRSELINLIPLADVNPEWKRLLVYLRGLEQFGAPSEIVRQAKNIIETNPKESERFSIIDSLTNVSDPSATRVLISNLQHVAPDTRNRVLLSLGGRLNNFNDPIDEEMETDLISALTIFRIDWQIEPIVRALGRSGTLRAAQAIEEAFQNNDDENSKAAVADAFGLFAGNSSTPIHAELLVEPIRNTRNRTLLLNAAGSAAKLHCKDALKAIAAVLDRDDVANDYVLSKELFERLGWGKDDALDILAHFLTYTNLEFRNFAVKTLISIGSNGAINLLQRHLPNESVGALQRNIEDFLKRITKS